MNKNKIPLPSSPNQDNGREGNKPYYSHSNEEIEKYQRLFNAIHGSNGIALESEMDDIIKIVHEDFPVAKKYTTAPQPSKEVSRTAMQEMIDQLKGSISIIDKHGTLNDFAQNRKMVYTSVLDLATKLLELERKQMEDKFNEGCKFITDEIARS